MTVAIGGTVFVVGAGAGGPRISFLGTFTRTLGDIEPARLWLSSARTV